MGDVGEDTLPTAGTSLCEGTSSPVSRSCGSCKVGRRAYIGLTPPPLLLNGTDLCTAKGMSAASTAGAGATTPGAAAAAAAAASRAKGEGDVPTTATRSGVGGVGALLLVEAPLASRCTGGKALVASCSKLSLPGPVRCCRRQKCRCLGSCSCCCCCCCAGCCCCCDCGNGGC